MDNMIKNRFILGIGSQRAGSTLLHHLLSKSSDIFMHPVKELHFFDTLYGYREKSALKDFSTRQVFNDVDRILSANNFDFIGLKFKNRLRTNKIFSSYDIEKIDYYDLFRPYLSKKYLLGEVTPEYMLLNEEHIIRMKAVIGEDAGIILLCRNPFDRLRSALKLMNVYNNLNMDATVANDWLRYQILNETQWIKCQDLYNDYERAIRLYSKHFRFFIALSYEQLINSPLVTANLISEKLNIKIENEIFARLSTKKINSLSDEFFLNPETMAIVEARYSQYNLFFREFFKVE
ncbi:sulfotransferase [Polynucleobacter sp. JS-JIR-II-c23]|uniref:sulfotransferase n=1 Tax=Polynucleobacter sp. JS-JIR-II-c23 TaxID=1758393 RepID=UPI002B237529|nr:sulfotransferase [Polynucleobacter sp. JS-JIR-II-c23]MEA9603801.1 sulfotransferase [Polynucleobacter sp. JS-JIR-II-c23]